MPGCEGWSLLIIRVILLVSTPVGSSELYAAAAVTMWIADMFLRTVLKCAVQLVGHSVPTHLPHHSAVAPVVSTVEAARLPLLAADIPRACLDTTLVCAAASCS